MVGRVSEFLLVDSFFSSVAQSCPTFCNPMDCSTPGFPVHHQLQKLAQTHDTFLPDIKKKKKKEWAASSYLLKVTVFHLALAC